MVKLHHLNCVEIKSPVGTRAIGHCLLLESSKKLVLIDTGIGLMDTKYPNKRIGKELVNLVGYHFDENQTAIRQIQSLGLDPKNVTDCVISHLDNDHIGGLADFPKATVHVGVEELDNYNSGNPRYIKTPLSHQPELKTYCSASNNWFGFEARRVEIDIDPEIFLIPLFGHTLGQCGIAIKFDDNWLFYVADSYYLKAELFDNDHPVGELAKLRADNNYMRIETMNRLRKFVNENADIAVFSYHDPNEFPEST